MSLFLDTNAVISLLKGDTQIVNEIKATEEIYISIITVIEFFSYAKLSENDKNLFHTFSSRVSVMDIAFENKTLINKIAELRVKHKIKIPDAIILAQSIMCKSKLVTVDENLLKNFKKETHGD